MSKMRKQNSDYTTITTIKRLLHYARGQILFWIFALIFALLSVFSTLMIPVIIGRAIDQMIGTGLVQFEILVQNLLLLSIFIAIGAVTQWLYGVCTNLLTQRTIRNMRNDFIEKLQRVPLSFYDNHAHGDIMSRVVNDMEFIGEGILQGFSQLFTGIAMIVGTLIFMLQINVQIAIIVVLLTPISLIFASLIAKYAHKTFQIQSETRGKIAGYIEEYIGNQKLIYAFSREHTVIENFENINQELYDSGVKSHFYSATINPTTRFINGIVYAVVAVVGAFFIVNGRALSVGQLTCFLSYANQYTKPFNEISGVVTELQNAFASAKRVFRILDASEETPDSVDTEKQTFRGEITIRDLTFSYTPDTSLIEHFNLHVQSGQKVAIVGPTGCGKTTLINLLMRFYEPLQGEIAIDGIPIQQMSRKKLRALYGMVLQESWLFSGTIRENIAYGKPDATLDEVIQAAKAANAHAFIRKLDNGYDTVLSENGSNLSQGQKQLLCIARILLTNPPMLILDEATSNIDTRTELQVQKAFDTIMQGRTAFIVAHRLSTIREADVILAMNKGKIIEQGTHAQLLQRNGFYAKLYNSQFSKHDRPTQ